MIIMTNAEKLESSASSPGQPAFAELVASVEGLVATHHDPEWNTARLAWNLAVDQRPDAVVVAQSAADVRATLNFARDNKLRVLPQSTGHLAGPVGNLEGSILLRTEALNTIDIDPDARTVRVGSGVLWGEVTAALADHGLMALAGSSPDVGVAGYLLGGGVSWFARSFGLATSYITALEVVTGEGRMLHATATESSELFFALRGGGGNHGIVTAITFSVFAITEVYAGMLLFPLERADEVITAWQRWTSEIDESASTSFRLLRLPPLPELPEFLRGQSFAAIDGAITIEQADAGFDVGQRTAAAEELLAPLRVLGPLIDTFGVLPAHRLGEVHMDPPGPVPGSGDGANLRELPREALDALLALAGHGVESPLLALEIRHIGGQMAKPARSGGAVDHLDGDYLLYAVGIAPTPEAIAAVEHATREVIAAVEPWRADADYLNFREVSTPADRLYPEATLERLRAIKRLHDPNNVVRSAHPLH